SLTLNDTPYGVGAFMYRDSPGSGTFAATGARLKWNYGLNGFDTLPEDIEVSLYATEMVYIPEGPFAFGDGNGTTASDYSWRVKGTSDYVYVGDYLAPLMVNPHWDADDQARLIGIRVHGKEGMDWDGDGVIDNPRFPTGYKAFYIMKYETTQGQYADFLNTLNPNQISNAYLFPNTIQNRFTITLQEGKYVCSRPDRACNYLEDKRPASLADWMALRPMSAMEYEKAARGPLNPVVNEYAWGTASSVIMTGISSEENGTEFPLPENSNIRGSASLSGGDGGQGPVRAGIFARENTDRITSGESYWGVMELSGNMGECMQELTYDGTYRGYQDNHGDGEIPYHGYANSLKYLHKNGYLENLSQAYSLRYSRVSFYSVYYNEYSGARFVRNAPELP
ncbi:MAG: hypothetical protein IH588_18855, partial [Anaerolineales bacterium]|nr:hypothetical protein [Anaerolineales bacterium]